MLEIKILNFLQLTFTQQTNMTSKDIFYQYKTLESPIELYIKPLNENLKFKGNILNLYEKEDCRKLELFITAKVNYADSVLPAELKNIFEYLDLILLIKSKKSVYRKCIIFEKKGNILHARCASGRGAGTLGTREAGAVVYCTKSTQNIASRTRDGSPWGALRA